MKCKQTNKTKQEWDSFVWNSLNGNIFHTQKFLDYHPKNRFENTFLEFTERGKTKAMMPAAIINDEIIYAYPGASYGGIVFNKKTTVHQTLDIINALMEYTKQQKLWNQLNKQLAKCCKKINNKKEEQT